MFISPVTKGGEGRLLNSLALGGKIARLSFFLGDWHEKQMYMFYCFFCFFVLVLCPGPKTIKFRRKDFLLWQIPLSLTVIV